MFGFITKRFKKKEKPVSVIVTEIPEQIKNDSQIVDPSKSHVVKDVGTMPDTTVDGQIEKSVGHINFGKTKSITRKFKAAKIREEIEKKKAERSSRRNSGDSDSDSDDIVYLG